MEQHDANAQTVVNVALNVSNVHTLQKILINYKTFARKKLDCKCEVFEEMPWLTENVLWTSDFLDYLYQAENFQTK